VDQAFGTTQDTNPDLFWLQAAGRLRLVPHDQQLPCKTAQGLPYCDETQTPATFPEGD
jgi:hypothetical protein